MRRRKAAVAQASGPETSDAPALSRSFPARSPARTRPAMQAARIDRFFSVPLWRS